MVAKALRVTSSDVPCDGLSSSPTRPFFLSATPINANKSIKGFVALLHDLTDRSGTQKCRISIKASHVTLNQLRFIDIHPFTSQGRQKSGLRYQMTPGSTSIGNEVHQSRQRWAPQLVIVLLVGTEACFYVYSKFRLINPNMFWWTLVETGLISQVSISFVNE